MCLYMQQITQEQGQILELYHQLRQVISETHHLQ